jgi:hypothetical protein
VRYFEDPSRARIPSAPGLVGRWLPVAAITAFVVLVVWQNVTSWPVYAAVGVMAAFVLAGAVRSRGVSDSSVIRQSEAGWAALHSELARSRRHDRRFALLTVPSSVWASPGSDADQTLEAGLRAAIAVESLLRRPDRAWTDGVTLFVLVTDCDRDQAAAFLARARPSMPHLFGDEQVQLAVFPENGVTLGALLARHYVAAEEALTPAPSQ